MIQDCEDMTRDVMKNIDNDSCSQPETRDVAEMDDFVQKRPLVRRNFVTSFPQELVEEIFSYLNVADLKNCAEVSLRWREAANRKKFWKRFCEKKNLYDPTAFQGVESNFINKVKRFQCAEDYYAPRLAPTNEWKLLYCQMNFVRLNWKRGRFVTHWCGKNIVSQDNVILPSKLPTHRVHLPIIERNPNRLMPSLYDLNVLRLDGKPRFVQRLVSSKFFSAVCADRDAIVYLNENIVYCCKWNHIQGNFSEAEPLGTIIPNERVDRMEYGPVTTYLTMDKNYIIVGYFKTAIKIWCRGTNTLKVVIQLPLTNSIFSNYCLHDGILFFSCSRKSDRTWFVRNYNIAKDEWGSEISLSNPIKRILCDNRYLLIGLKENVNNFLITLYERRTNMLVWSLPQDSSQNWGMLRPVVNLFGDHVFYLEAYNINIVSVSTGELVKTFTVNCTVQSVENIHGDLILLRSRNEVELWNWREGTKLYTPGLECTDSDLFIDDTRLVFVGHGKEIKVLGFW